MLAGIGEGVVEGLGTPFVQGLHKEEPGRYVNFSHGFWSLGVLVSALLFAWMLMVEVSWRWVLVAAAAFAVPPMLLMLLPEGRRRYPERPNKVESRHVFEQVKAICRTPRFWLYFSAMLLAGGGEYCLTFWVASFVQLTFAGSVMAGGIATAVFAMGMFTGRTGFGFLLHQRHLKMLMIVMGVFGTLVCAAIPTLSQFEGAWVLYVLFVVLFLAGIATAPFWPSLQTHAVTRLPGLDATMVYVLLSCAGVPGCGIFTLVMGYLGKAKAIGLAQSFYIVPVCFAGIVVLLLADRKSKKGELQAN